MLDRSASASTVAGTGDGGASENMKNIALRFACARGFGVSDSAMAK
jgi:hypothetical protein